MDKAQIYAKNPVGWLLITGPAGTGKTHLAATIINEARALGVNSHYESVPDLLDRIRNEGQSAQYDVVSAHLLVMDDVGMHHSTEWAEKTLNAIIGRRRHQQLPTVIAVGGELVALTARLQSMLADRALTDPIHLRRGVPGPQRDNIDLTDATLAKMTFRTFTEKGRRGATKTQRQTLAEAKEAAQIFAEEPQKWLFFSGDTGVGKTHLATAIASMQIELNRSFIFKFVPDLMDEMRNALAQNNHQSSYRMLDNLKETPLLILDDLGSQNATAWAEEKLYQLIVHRHEREMPTVVTSRLMLDEPNESYGFSPKYSKALMSRLRDSYVVSERLMSAPDFRNRGSQSDK